MKKKSKEKNIISNETVEQYDDFNEENFTDFDEVDEDKLMTENHDSLEPNDLDPEYHGADADLPPDILPQEKKSIINTLKDNWLYLGIGIIVFVVAMYLIMSVFSNSNSTGQNTQAVATPQGFTSVPASTSTSTSSNQPASSVTTVNGANNIQPVAAVPAATANNASNSEEVMPTTSPAVSDAQTQALLQSVSKMIQQNNNDLKNSLAGSASGKSRQSLSSIEASISTLSSNVDKLNQTLAAVQSKLTNTEAQLTILLASQTATDQNLTLRAVVPGRAWLIDQSGRTTSVTEGTPLGSFGVITNIDSTNNTVTTSSGYVFK